MLGKGRSKDEIQRLKNLYKGHADPIDKAIIDKRKEIGHTFLDLKILHDEESRLQMIKIAAQDKTNEAISDPDTSHMASRWAIRQDAVRQKRRLEEALGLLPTMVDFDPMDPENG